MTAARDSNPVRQRRDELGLTLMEVATRMGRPASMINNVEGGFVPQKDTQLAFAVALESTPDVLFPGEWERA